MKRQKKTQSWGNSPTSMFTEGLLFYLAREHPFCVAAHGKEAKNKNADAQNSNF